MPNKGYFIAINKPEYADIPIANTAIRICVLLLNLQTKLQNFK